ncbi:SWIM zinc finger family protein [Streptomyces phaeoluteigriseus]|uniref:SWIM zinc finger family protein n=1 Tax=Streptomyces phaeoluteigriseus TaxID=114686 RepID=A0ABY4ZD00_9ACTN|nr:SWIM zinc finger family protein [Streptomyces phaeoluteigriseus]USQ86777.1 SWIM zinc finger family protein [Streptomyces phaeoluteigriseus]
MSPDLSPDRPGPDPSPDRPGPGLPPVAPSVTAELVGALSPRLRKRLDAGVAKLAARPVVRDGDSVRIAVDDDTDLELHAPDGTVTRVDAIRCGCLLAPDCLHRAAAASAAPVADDTPPSPPADEPADATRETRREQPETETAGPEERAAARAVFAAAAAVLEAGTDGSGAVLQAELLRAAHTARLAGLPRASAAAVSVVTGVRAARSADPAYRLADLADALGGALGVAHRLPHATGADLAELRGTARQPYRPDGSLRLYGLFSEPVLTTTGYAGAVTWTADAEGRLYTVSDVAPGGPGRATGAADRAVRIGDTSLTHRELARAGLAVSGATVSPTGRLGAGAGVRAVRASGAAWRGEPLDRLWAVPVADQVARALGGGHDLLFLDVTLMGTVREATGDCLLADCAGLPLRFATAHDAPALPYRDNLRLLAAAGGMRLRVVARLAPGPLPRALLLATEHPSDPAARVDLGLDRLQHADLPAGKAPAAAPVPVVDEAPLHLLRRRVHQAVSGGRRVLAFPGGAAGDGARLRRVGLGTAGDLLDELHAAAADRARDAFGRLLPSDSDRFAGAWLAAAVYTGEVERALCAQAWGVSAVPA